MNDLDAILNDLPHMPKEVVEHWLLPHAARPGHGWPPANDGRDKPWSALLAARPLSWWRDRIWHKEPLGIVLDHMSHATQFQIARLVKATQEGRDYLPDSCRRIEMIRTYIAQKGTWPVPPVVYSDVDGLSFIDGFHRLAALMMERSQGHVQPDERHAVWIALPPKTA